jgi:hypothetical protein
MPAQFLKAVVIGLARLMVEGVAELLVFGWSMGGLVPVDADGG